MVVVTVYLEKNESVVRERIDPVSVSFVLILGNLSSCYSFGIFHKVQKKSSASFSAESFTERLKYLATKSITSPSA